MAASADYMIGSINVGLEKSFNERKQKDRVYKAPGRLL